MTKEEYIGTIVVRNKKVDIGVDDPGQQFFGEYTDPEGTLHTIGCGAYNPEFLEVIIAQLDPKGYYVSTHTKQLWDKLVQDNLDYSGKNIDYDDYDHYDFKKMYELFYSKNLFSDDTLN